MKTNQRLKIYRILPFFLLAMLGFSGAALAQIATSTIRGQVVDPSGAALPGVTVTAELTGTGLKTSSVTDTDGRFFVGGLKPGAYTVSAELVGFKKATQTELFLKLRDTLQLEFQLELSGVEQEVTVTAEGEVLNPQSTEVSQQISTEEIDALPINDRDFMDLALLTPGVKEGRDPTMLGTQVAFGAQDSSQTYVSNDGADTTSHLIGGTLQTFIQETIQEYKVVGGSFGAEFGRSSGGAVTVVSKSGTNQIEGGAWEYFRNKSLQAKSEFQKKNNDFTRHQFGGMVSGPIIKDKTHFLAAFERRDQDGTIATPQSALDTFGSLLKEDFPNSQVTNNVFLKIDQQIGQNQHLFVRYTHEDRKTTNSPNLTGFKASIATESNYFSEDQSTDSILASHNFSPWDNAFNQLSLSFVVGDRPNARNTDSPEELRPSSRQGGFFLAGFDDTQEKGFGLTEELSAQMGNHTLKFGGNLQRRHMQLLFPIFSNSQFTFGCIPALPIGGVLVPDPAGCSADLPFNPLNPFSYPTIRIAGSGTPLFDQDKTVASAFIQDEFQVTDRLNLNLGLRWDYDSGEFDGDVSSPLITEQNPIAPLREALKASGLLNPPEKDMNNIAPRIGLSWDVQGDSSLLVHGGSGVYYGVLTGSVPLFSRVVSGLRTAAGQIGDYAVTITPLPDYKGIPNPLRGGAPESAIPLLYNMDPDAKTAYTIQSTVGIGKTLGDKMAVTVDLVSAIGRNELITVDVNAPTKKGTDGKYIQASRPLTLKYGIPFGPIRTFKTIGESDYKSFQVSLQRRYANGWQAQANYTYSKALNWQDNPTSDLPEDSLCPECEEGPSSQDQRHIFNGSGSVDLPLGIKFSSLVKVGSGIPFNVIAGEDLNGDLVGNDRGGLERASGRSNGYFRLDARIAKEFTFNRVHINLMAEAFNLTNHKNYDPDTYNGEKSSSNFGEPTNSTNQTFDPFQVQLGAKVTF